MIEEQLILFLDSEGEETQEMAAILVDTISMKIKDVYLNWAKPPSKLGLVDIDWYSRKHVHGLSRTFLQNRGLESEEALVADFQTWLQQYQINEFCGHAPAKEEILLGRQITDVKLPPWKDRLALESFRITQLMKSLDISVLGKRCSRSTVHCEYKNWSRFQTPGDHVRQVFGHHCAFYDCVMILLFTLPDIELFSP